MTTWLRKRLAIGVGVGLLGGALLWDNGALHAQEEAGAEVPANPIAAFFSPIFKRARQNSIRSACQQNLAQISLGLLQYQQDYDEKFPPAKTWINVTMPYMKSEKIFNCPSLPKGKSFGYALSSKAAEKESKAFKSQAQTVLLYETQILKRNAFGMGENRANRHLDGANYAFVDGHVKWFIKTKTPNFKLKP